MWQAAATLVWTRDEAGYRLALYGEPEGRQWSWSIAQNGHLVAYGEFQGDHAGAVAAVEAAFASDARGHVEDMAQRTPFELTVEAAVAIEALRHAISVSLAQQREAVDENGVRRMVAARMKLWDLRRAIRVGEPLVEPVIERWSPLVKADNEGNPAPLSAELLQFATE